MQVLAIDPSTKSTGLAVFSDQELKHYECIAASSTNLFKRIHKMADNIDRVIEDYNIDKIIMEEVIPTDVHNNQSVFKALMYLQGFIMEVFDKHNITPVLMTSSEWRKKCGIHTGRGILRESLKPKDIQFVQSQFGIKVNDDIADAICLGFAAVGGVIKESQIIKDEDGFEFG